VPELHGEHERSVVAVDGVLTNEPAAQTVSATHWRSVDAVGATDWRCVAGSQAVSATH
jgi:hypothetical protein